MKKLLTSIVFNIFSILLITSFTQIQNQLSKLKYPNSLFLLMNEYIVNKKRTPKISRTRFLFFPTKIFRLCLTLSPACFFRIYLYVDA